MTSHESLVIHGIALALYSFIYCSHMINYIDIVQCYDAIRLVGCAIIGLHQQKK